jgi:hypothetical protein
MRIGILGTRGIPNHYGGFEQFAERLSEGLVQQGHEVWVYNSHNHSVQERHWHGVNLVHCYDPEFILGVPGQFVYDLNCIRDSRKRDFDVILQLGYTSSSVWHKFLPRRPKILTNMDGLEWQRRKYRRSVRRFLKFAEKLAVKTSDHLIADSEVIRDYLATAYKVAATYIPYGADIFANPDESKLVPYMVKPKEFFLVIARMQPDNNIKEIIQGVLQSDSCFPLLVIGNMMNRYGKILEKSYGSDRIRFLGPIFKKDSLNNLRYFSRLYFHGHSSGGTNPSLLEAMAASATICAHDNPFSREVLGKNAFFFSDSWQLTELIALPHQQNEISPMIMNNISKIRTKYNWSEVIYDYGQVFAQLNTG